jgi:hypothetical protein
MDRRLTAFVTAITAGTIARSAAAVMPGVPVAIAAAVSVATAVAILALLRAAIVAAIFAPALSPIFAAGRRMPVERRPRGKTARQLARSDPAGPVASPARPGVGRGCDCDCHRGDPGDARHARDDGGAAARRPRI